MSGLQGFRAAYTTLGPVGALATVAGAVALVVLGTSLVTFTRGAMTTAPEVDASGQVGRKGDDKTIEKYLAQINGRSMLLRPGRVAQKEPEPAPVDTGPPPPPPAPTSYDGSKIIAMVLDTVWFDDGRKMKVGDAEKDDTEVVSVNAPWDAKLRWKKVEFTVPLFGRDAIVVKKGESGSASSTAASIPPSSETEAPPTTPDKATEDTKTAASPADKPVEKPADPPKPGGEKIAAGATSPSPEKPTTEPGTDAPAPK
jgi:hypothetical protein